MKQLIFSLLIFFALSFTLHAEEMISDTLKIETTAQCEMCKERIEKAVNEMEGIKYVDLDVTTAVVSVVYNKEETTDKDIRETIADVGYDADDVKKDKRAYKRLPKCCQLGGHK